jgi:hypothetical protein
VPIGVTIIEESARIRSLGRVRYHPEIATRDTTMALAD